MVKAVVGIGALLLLMLPVASAAGLVETLEAFAPSTDEATRIANDAVASAERMAFDAAADSPAAFPQDPLVTVADGFAVPFDSVAAVFLGLAAAAAVGVAGGARFVTPAEVLQNPVREDIFRYLRTRTGATLKQLTTDRSLTTTNAIWHLRKLEDAGLIHSRRYNGFKVFYPAEGGVQARRLSLSMTVLQNPNAQDVFAFVLQSPGSHQREMARALGVNHGTVRWHLKKLRHAELLVEERRGKTSTYFVTDVGRAAFDNVQAAARAVPLPPVTATSA